jgi:peptidoglycan/LPS O-acetylase OafA/YrhL
MRNTHLYPVDMVRVLTFACVIAVHTISTVNSVQSVYWGGATILLHFTREAFFVLTAFVLTNRYRHNPPRVPSFLRRRFLLVGVPYLVWSLIYSGIGLAAAPVPFGPATTMVLRNLATGTSWFHLYFLLVSLQFYLVFPLFRRLLRATSGHHGALLVLSGAAQLLLDLWLHDPAPTGFKAAVLPYAGSFVLSYQFFLVIGGVAAVHHVELARWSREHRRLLLGALVGTAVLAEGRYLWQVTHGSDAVFATDVFQTVVLPWSVAVVASFYLAGMAWADRRDGELGSRLLERASDRSFGVFLVHPVILWALTAAGPHSPASHLPAPLSSFAIYPVAVLGSLAFVELVRRTPLSLMLTGKQRVRPDTAAAVPAAGSRQPSRPMADRTTS